MIYEIGLFLQILFQRATILTIIWYGNVVNKELTILFLLSIPSYPQSNPFLFLQGLSIAPGTQSEHPF